MDIKALLSEFGDFGDFFENDALPFGEVILVFWMLPIILLIKKLLSAFHILVIDM